MGRRARLGVYFEEKYDWIRGITEDRKEQNKRKRKIQREKIKIGGLRREREHKKN